MDSSRVSPRAIFSVLPYASTASRSVGALPRSSPVRCLLRSKTGCSSRTGAGGSFSSSCQSCWRRPERVGEIAKAVRASPTFSSWEPDFTPDSLVPLGAWLAEGITTRARTSEEIQELETDKPYPIQIPDHILTNRSYSLAVDVGMYL